MNHCVICVATRQAAHSVYKTIYIGDGLCPTQPIPIGFCEYHYKAVKKEILAETAITLWKKIESFVESAVEV